MWTAIMDLGVHSQLGEVKGSTTKVNSRFKNEQFDVTAGQIGYNNNVRQEGPNLHKPLLTKENKMKDIIRTLGIIAIVPGIIAVATHMPWCMHCVH